MRVTDTKSFIKRAKLLHGDKYNYDKTTYINSKTKVTVTCPVHGDFEQNPANHYTKSGCPKCARFGYVRSAEEVIKQFITVHGTIYDYRLVNYLDENTHIDIICPTHGVFTQQPKGHKQGQGCPKCAIAARTLTKNEILQRFQKAHGSKYDYSKVDYNNKDSKVVIICPEHGEFQQRPADHWKGIGCQKCSGNGFDSSLPGYLYYLSINNGQAYKIGITNKSVQERFTVTDLQSIQVLSLWKFTDGAECYAAEQAILKQFKEFQYKDQKLLSSGNTELFNVDIYQTYKEQIDEITTMGELQTP
jgi:hypothetical protein